MLPLSCRLTPHAQAHLLHIQIIFLVETHAGLHLYLLFLYLFFLLFTHYSGFGQVICGRGQEYIRRDVPDCLIVTALLHRFHFLMGLLSAL